MSDHPRVTTTTSPHPTNSQSPTCEPAREGDDAARALTTSRFDIRTTSVVGPDASAEESVIGFDSGRKAPGVIHDRH